MKSTVRIQCVVLFALPLAVAIALTASDAQAAGMMGPRGSNMGMASAQQTRAGMMQSPFGAMMNPFGNVYGMTGQMNPYTGMSSASTGGSGSGYGGSGSGYGGGGSQGGGSQGDLQGYGGTPASATAAYQTYPADASSTPQVSDSSRLLTASGVPNDNGLVRWPIGLLALAGPQVDDSRDRVEALFQRAASQPSDSSGSAEMEQQIRKAVGNLRGSLLKDKNERFAMPLAVYEESERFLNRLDRAGRVLSAGLTKSGP